nr:MAG TPA: hypothetical protein [Caudoviricetes sp.]
MNPGGFCCLADILVCHKITSLSDNVSCYAYNVPQKFPLYFLMLLQYNQIERKHDKEADGLWICALLKKSLRSATD